MKAAYPIGSRTKMTEDKAMLETLARTGLIPVIVVDEADQAVPLADALVAGDLPIMEITLRSDAGLAAITNVSGRSDLLVGAGTVLNAVAAEKAVDAGAQFVVAPGLDEETVAYCQSAGVPVFPGVCTATEVQRAWNLGLRVTKFFPAEAYGGAKTLKALGGPFAEMRFIPTGGIRVEQLASYLELSSVLAVGGSWMVPREMIRKGEFQQIQELAQTAVDKIQQIRQSR